ncbi:major facilitator superfamily domain-containing protein [Xylariaceae sp. FL1272]|nr:major facilitator superfamily domain-containing protein [Xylariaceae sp. FL1272]
MDPETQVDLAKDEASAAQALRSLVVTNDNTPASAEPRRSSRGTIASTFQVRLKPPSSRGTRAGSTGRARPSVVSLSTQAGIGTGTEKDSEEYVVAELRPVDRGFGAWSYVAAAFSMFIVVWGFPQAFPIFQTYLSAGPGAAYPDSIAIRLLAPGLQDIEEGIIFPLLPRGSRFRRKLVVAGILIILISLLSASYATSDWQIVLFQGVVFGIGGILINFAHVSLFSEWFDKRKGQAMGIIWTGWRVGALGFPLICQWLLYEHGFQKTIHVLIGPMLSLLVPAILLFRGRFDHTIVGSAPDPPAIPKFHALRAPSVLYCLVASVLFFLIINVPKMFVTTFAADIGLKPSDQALSLVLLTLGDMIGTYALGWLSDTVHHEVLTASLAFLTSLANVLGLGLSKSRIGVFTYAMSVGLASGGFSNCLFTFYGELANGNAQLFTAIHGLFSLFRGTAILTVGPVGAEILRRSPAVELDAFAINRYRYLLAYAAGSSCLSGILILSKHLVKKYKTTVD